MITDLKDLLHEIGYDRLSDNGAYWRTNAIYRDGDNKTSLRIHKRTGAFQDFVDKRYGTIEELIKLTLRIGDIELKKFYDGKSVNVQEIVERDTIPKITMEKTWNESELSNLLPHYKFYEDRGISKETLKRFRCGFAHSGSMNERFVFPIYNEDGLIHGWSGRDMTGKKEAKWKHLGRKASWIYPLFVPYVVKLPNGQMKTTYPVLDAIKKTREVVLVESIGDMLSLWERGQWNVFVTFGLEISTKLASFIMSLDIDRVVIAMNNDFEKEDGINRGLNSAYGIFIDLMHYVEFQKIRIALPQECNDFGDINDDQYENWKSAKNQPQSLEILDGVLCVLRAKYKANDITPAEIKFGKIIKNEYDQIKGN